MQNQPDQELANLMHQELRRLPDLKAPPIIATNVMAAIRAREHLPWWQCPWITWPRLAQSGSALAVFTLLGALGYFAARTGHQVDSFSQYVIKLLAPVRSGLDSANALVAALGNFARLPGEQFMLYAAILAGVMYLTCVGIGTVLYRTVFQKR